MTTGTQFGDQATYSCIEGYRLEGDRVRTCQSSGFWSGRAPFCSSKFVNQLMNLEFFSFSLLSSTVVTCPLLDPPKDGRVSFSSTSFNSVAIYECFPGYRLEGVTERTCQADGFWSDQEPVCRSELTYVHSKQLKIKYTLQ